MSFLNPALLIGLLAAGLPVLIHLLNKRRHRTVKWAAMQFLLRATRESRGAKKLRHIVILTLRALAVAAIIFAIARPLVSSLMGFGNGRVETVVFLLDRSVSMEATESGSTQSKREAAIQSIVSSLDGLGEARLVLIDSATLVPQEVPDPSQLVELTDAQPAAAAANVPAMLEAAASYIRAASTGRTEIWLASDLQRTTWAPDDGRWATSRTSLAELPGDPKLRILSYSGLPDDNVAISVPRVRRLGSELTVDVSLSRRLDQIPVEVPVTFNIDGAAFTENFTLEGQNLTFSKTFQLASGNEGGTGSVSIIPDGNVADDSAYFTYGADTPTDVAIIAADISLTRPLELMASPPGYGNTRATTKRPEELQQIDLNSMALVIWQGALPSGNAATRLESYVRSGGQLFLLPPRNASDTTFLDLQWGETQTAPAEQFFIAGNWNEDDGPLRSSRDGVALPVGKLRAVLRRNLISDQKTDLATWDGGEPLLSRQIIDAGRVVAITTLPDYSWSNLPDGSILVPVFQRMIEAGAERLGGTHSTIAGTSRAAALPGETVTRLDSREARISDASGINVGLYQFGERQIAISRPPAEDDWELLSEAAQREVLRDTGATFSTQSAEDDSTLAREVWQAFLLACLLFLIGEAILCLPKAMPDAASPRATTT